MVVNDYTVSIAPPNGAPIIGGSISLSPDPAIPDDGDPRRFSELRMDGRIVGQLSADKHRGQRWRVMVALIPTVNTRDQDRRAASGSWDITIHRNAGKPMTKSEQINVWVQRDDDPALLNTGGQQSRLVQSPPAPDRIKKPDQQYEPYLDFVRGYGALNGIGSSPSITRVAGYVQDTQRVSYYSGCGGLTALPNGKATPWGPQTTISAVSDQSAMRGGTPSIGVTSGSRTRLVGTSGAAPSVSRLMAINAAAGRDLMDGMLPAPPLHPNEDASKAIVHTMHKARLGDLMAPPLTP
jgi:hypothetical protein